MLIICIIEETILYLASIFFKLKISNLRCIKICSLVVISRVFNLGLLSTRFVPLRRNERNENKMENSEQSRDSSKRINACVQFLFSSNLMQRSVYTARKMPHAMEFYDFMLHVSVRVYLSLLSFRLFYFVLF